MLSRRDFLASATAAAGVVTFSDSAPAQPTTHTGPGAIDDFFASFTADWVRHDPELATRTRFFTEAGQTNDAQDRLERQLSPRTLFDKRDRIRRARLGLTQLRRFDRTNFTDLQRVSAEVMEWQLDNIVREEPFLDYTFPLEQMNGANVGLVETMTVRHPLGSDRDAENYVAALGQVRLRMQESIAESKRLQAKNIVPPTFILEATLKQMQSFADPSPAQNPFVTVFADKMASVREFPTEKRVALQAEAANIVATQIYPIWKEAIALLESQKPLSTNDAGLWRLKGGAEAYSYFLRRYTTTDLTADQIHDIGLENVARIEKEMDGLLRRLGRTNGTVKDRIEKLKADMAYPNPTSQESRIQIMRDIDGILENALDRSALLFDVRPKSRIVAQPFPTFREANAAANYNAPAPDGSRPGVFQFPRRVENMTKFGLRSIVYHETVPGHHFQIGLQVENKDLPRFRQIGAFGGISALTEGWGLYAERLASESGWYGDDLEGQLGQLYYELFRARRLVVDTGLHAKKWTRRQAIDYGIEASEIERYVVYPGQACSYMMGELKLLDLRGKSKLPLREFHNVVLRTGTVPLNVLEHQFKVS
jgi:uncharacterized protein (DUF885 family)